MSGVVQVRRRQLVLEAMQFSDDPAVIAELSEWMDLPELTVTWDRGAPQLLVESPEGVVRADAGWWVIRLESGKFRALPNDVYLANFEETPNNALSPTSPAVTEDSGETPETPSPTPDAPRKPEPPLTDKELRAAQKAAERAAREAAGHGNA